MTVYALQPHTQWWAAPGELGLLQWAGAWEMKPITKSWFSSAAAATASV